MRSTEWTGADTPSSGGVREAVGVSPRPGRGPSQRLRPAARGAAVGFPIARPLEVEDLRPLGQPVEDRVGHGIVVEDLVPLAEDPIRCDHRRPAPIVPGGDDLEEQVPLGLPEGHVAHLIE